MRRRALLAAAVIAAAAALPARGAGMQVRAYAFTRGSHYLLGSNEFVTPVMTLPRGTELVFVNLHLFGHSMYSDFWKTPTQRLFKSEAIPFGKQSVVRGVESLPPGSYGYFCSNHEGMRGTLTIV